MMISIVGFAGLCAPLVYLTAAFAFRKQHFFRVGLFLAAGAFAAAVLCDILLALAKGTEAGSPVFLDAFSAAILTLITFVGFVVVRYSITYLDGDPDQPRFMSWLCLTLAAVSALVIAGDLRLFALAWIATSLALHKLLVFRSERPRAIIAARKKFIVARIGDAALLGAVYMMMNAFGTAEIAAILEGAQNMKATGGAPGLLALAPVFLVIAAVLKSGQFPTHGWLGEVMETPTPVSALLHAGIINAGGFLIIRFADVMLLNGSAMHALALIGGFTALFGSIVMLTQTSIKVSLAYSTVAQMGFMLLQCGLGVFSAATLHIIAHSLYKAHAFLSSGRAVTLSRISRPAMTQKKRDAVFAVLSALALYLAIGVPFGGRAGEEPAILALGAIYIIGLSMYLSALLADTNSRALGLGLAGFATAFYFLLQNAFATLLAGAIPAPLAPDAVGNAVIVIALGSFAVVAFAQVFHLPATDKVRAFYVHAAQGFYANAIFNRLIGALRVGRDVYVSRSAS
ncbi:MAG: oxidoreductase [Alphaproteobacteria bacterium]|nr:oxidoreductase [Alphaproteobacteria bacterium]